MTASATYVYCIVASSTPPPAGAATGLPGTGPVRAIEIKPGRYLVVSDVPMAELGEAQLAAKMSDLDWVSRAAVAHEGVNEAFMNADAVVPMKLFTLFTSDERALDEIRKGWKRVDGLIKRLNKSQEWGVRLVFDESRAPKASLADGPVSGRGYLQAKRQQHEASTRRSSTMRKTAGDVIKTLRPMARDVEKRSVTEPPDSRSRLLLDAAFLVPRAKADRFRKSVEERARKIAPQGYALQLSGPWPPYSFV